MRLADYQAEPTVLHETTLVCEETETWNSKDTLAERPKQGRRFRRSTRSERTVRIKKHTDGFACLLTVAAKILDNGPRSCVSAALRRCVSLSASLATRVSRRLEDLRGPFISAAALGPRSGSRILSTAGRKIRYRFPSSKLSTRHVWEVTRGRHTAYESRGGSPASYGGNFGAQPCVRCARVVRDLPTYLSACLLACLPACPPARLSIYLRVCTHRTPCAVVLKARGHSRTISQAPNRFRAHRRLTGLTLFSRPTVRSERAISWYRAFKSEMAYLLLDQSASSSGSSLLIQPCTNPIDESKVVQLVERAEGGPSPVSYEQMARDEKS